MVMNVSNEHNNKQTNLNILFRAVLKKIFKGGSLENTDEIHL